MTSTEILKILELEFPLDNSTLRIAIRECLIQGEDYESRNYKESALIKLRKYLKKTAPNRKWMRTYNKGNPTGHREDNLEEIKIYGHNNQYVPK